MTEREKVVSHLQILRTWCAVNPDFGMGLDIDDCPKAVEWLDAALALLKAQEPVEPIQDEDGDWICGACKEGMVGCDLIDASGVEAIRNEHCPNCGRAVKWSD